MKTIQLRCTLLSDIIINQKSATEGNQETLDFIPGNIFLGLAAASLYKNLKNEESMLIFHSGKVKFGDAHPIFDGKRSLKIPASWHYEKNKTRFDSLFVHHGIPYEGISENGTPIQLKQCRDGFIVKVDDQKFAEIEIEKNFAIKSAYDTKKRRSEDKKMFGYQSLQNGSVWEFELTLCDETLKFEDQIVNSLTGVKQIGRSSTAQYGLVQIEACKEINKNPIENFKSLQARFKGNTEADALFIYAESRLIFLDKYGQPTFTPNAEQLGLPGGDINWEKSQVRTFQYAPYNNQRKSRDADRCGIEKGSVFCVMGVSLEKAKALNFGNYVGSFQNEGFGKVILNPEFLDYVNQEGKSKYSILEDKVISYQSYSENQPSPLQADENVLKYLKNKKAQQNNQSQIYNKVNEFVINHAENFKGNAFASQWGTIRSIASTTKDYEKLYNALFKESNDRSPGYLVHGVAKEKWEERRRLESLRTFFKGFENNKNSVSEALVNLAAEMAKKCRRD